MFSYVVAKKDTLVEKKELIIQKCNKIQVFVNVSNKLKLQSQKMMSRNSVTSFFRIFLSSFQVCKETWIKMYKTIIFHAFLYGCETLSLLLWLCQGMQVLILRG